MQDWQNIILIGVGLILIKIIEMIITRYGSTRTYKEQVDKENNIELRLGRVEMKLDDLKLVIEKLDERFEKLKELVSEFIRKGR